MGRIVCLNPCFNGRYSRSEETNFIISVNIVLILVLMEDTLGDKNHILKQAFCRVVLILVLMEDTLGTKTNLESSRKYVVS